MDVGMMVIIMRMGVFMPFRDVQHDTRHHQRCTA